MNRMWMVLFLTVIWCGFSNDFSLPNVVLGLLVSLACSVLFGRHRREVGSRFNPLLLPVLVVLTVYELIKSSLWVSWEIVTPHHYSRPCMLSVPLTLKTMTGRTILGNVVSLTPGTLCVDIDEKGIMTVHAMFADDPDAVVAMIQQRLEPLVKKVFEYA